ncbi:MAG: ATP-binding protein [Lachnospiraceae bacterium]|nr:ATP-binding protein [Lachnospiraceae bacterium]
MNGKRLPIGIDSFENLRKADYYYIDKTKLIKELLDEACIVNLFTRPRRFGKSLNLDMLKSFFERGADRKLFEGLMIWEYEDICKAHFGKYPVIFLSLKDVDGEDYDMAYQALHSIVGMEIRRLCVKYALLESDILLDADKIFLNNVLEEKYDKGIAACLRRVFQLLSEVCGGQVILLIDEYDVPLDKAYQKGYYDQMLNSIRNLLSTVLKSNRNLQFAVLTGCLRIAKESIFTGLNNFVVNSISEEEYSEYFGFTEAEVLQMLRYYDLEERQESVKEWYDGYRFGNISIYCPWDVLNYLRKLRRNKEARPEAFWENSSSNAIIQDILLDASETTKEQIEMLISGETVEKKLMPELTYKDLEASDPEIRETYLWSVMYATGYLTESERLDNGISRLVIPNQEIWNIYVEKIRGWFRENVRNDSDRLIKFYEALKNGNAQSVQTVFNDCMSDCISIRDTYSRKEMKENFYHGMLLGILQCDSGWAVKSNQESGDGYGDILLFAPKDKVGCVIEVKYAEKGNFNRSCDEAMQQIEQNHYGDYFVQKDVQEVHLYAIACYKKACKVLHQVITK